MACGKRFRRANEGGAIVTFWLSAADEGEYPSDWQSFGTLDEAKAARGNHGIALILELERGVHPDEIESEMPYTALVYDYDGWRKPYPYAQHLKEMWINHD